MAARGRAITAYHEAVEKKAAIANQLTHLSRSLIVLSEILPTRPLHPKMELWVEDMPTPALLRPLLRELKEWTELESSRADEARRVGALK